MRKKNEYTAFIINYYFKLLRYITMMMFTRRVLPQSGVAGRQFIYAAAAQQQQSRIGNSFNMQQMVGKKFIKIDRSMCS
jgi:hypothetical protein